MKLRRKQLHTSLVALLALVCLACPRNGKLRLVPDSSVDNLRIEADTWLQVLVVDRCDAGVVSVTTYWAIGSDSVWTESHSRVFRYGEAPEGFESYRGPRTLTPGCYVASFGASPGRTFFEVLPTGDVQELTLEQAASYAQRDTVVTYARTLCYMVCLTKTAHVMRSGLIFRTARGQRLIRAVPGMRQAVNESDSVQAAPAEVERLLWMFGEGGFEDLRGTYLPGTSPCGNARSTHRPVVRLTKHDAFVSQTVLYDYQCGAGPAFIVERLDQAVQKLADLEEWPPR